MGKCNPSSGLTPSPTSAPFRFPLGLGQGPRKPALVSLWDPGPPLLPNPSGRPSSQRDRGFLCLERGKGGSRAGWTRMWVSFHHKPLLRFTPHLASLLLLHSEGGGKYGVKGWERRKVSLGISSGELSAASVLFVPYNFLKAFLPFNNKPQTKNRSQVLQLLHIFIFSSINY